MKRTLASYSLLICCALAILSGCGTKTVCKDIETKQVANHWETALQDSLHALLTDFPAYVGVSLIDDDGRVFNYCGDSVFPMLSVVKFPLALAVCQKLEQDGLSLDDRITVKSSELNPDTWSPMLKCYPKGGEISIRELLEYSLVQSDNNACDILFHHVADMRAVQDYVETLCPSGCYVEADERMMYDDYHCCYFNTVTPAAAAKLMDHFCRNHGGAVEQVVWDMMSKCETGANRIPKYLKDKASYIVHKTGTGPVAPKGTIVAVNDVACVVMPDGMHFTLAVFMTDAACSLEDCEEMIARIAQKCAAL